MKLMVSGTVYDMEVAIPKSSLQTLLIMKREYGYTMPMLAKLSKKLEAITDQMAILEDEDLLQGFLILIWLARRHAGEVLTLDESSDRVVLDELGLVSDDDEEPAVEDPKGLTGSVPVGAPPPPDRLPSTSKTSTPRFTSIL